MDEQKPSTYDEILAAQVNELPEFKATEGIEEAAEAALAAIRQRSFSGRNPELGKMIKCQVCGLRHRAAIICKQRFVYLYTEQDLESGVATDIVSELPLPGQKKTLKMVVGAKQFQGKRKRQRPNHSHLQIVEITKDLYGREEEYDRENKEHLALLGKIRAAAIGIWKQRRRRAAKLKRRQQDVSRRINRGLLQGGFRP